MPSTYKVGDPAPAPAFSYPTPLSHRAYIIVEKPATDKCTDDGVVGEGESSTVQWSKQKDEGTSGDWVVRDSPSEKWHWVRDRNGIRERISHKAIGNFCQRALRYVENGQVSPSSQEVQVTSTERKTKDMPGKIPERCDVHVLRSPEHIMALGTYGDRRAAHSGFHTKGKLMAGWGWVSSQFTISYISWEGGAHKTSTIS